MRHEQQNQLLGVRCHRRNKRNMSGIPFAKLMAGGPNQCARAAPTSPTPRSPRPLPARSDAALSRPALRVAPRLLPATRIKAQQAAHQAAKKLAGAREL